MHYPPSLLAAATMLALTSGIAQADKYHVTGAEKAACTADAIRLCMSAYPDEDKLIDCMRTNRPQLTGSCRVAFDAGLKRRHL